MGEFKSERKEVKIEEIVEDLSQTSHKKNKNLTNLKLFGFWNICINFRFFGLIASSLIFNLFTESSQNQIPKEEIIKNN